MRYGFVLLVIELAAFSILAARLTPFRKKDPYATTILGRPIDEGIRVLLPSSYTEAGKRWLPLLWLVWVAGVATGLVLAFT